MIRLTFIPKMPTGNTYEMLVSSNSYRDSNSSLSQVVAAALSRGNTSRSRESCLANSPTFNRKPISSYAQGLDDFVEAEKTIDRAVAVQRLAIQACIHLKTVCSIHLGTGNKEPRRKWSNEFEPLIGSGNLDDVGLSNDYWDVEAYGYLAKETLYRLVGLQFGIKQARGLNRTSNKLGKAAQPVSIAIKYYSSVR